MKIALCTYAFMYLSNLFLTKNAVCLHMCLKWGSKHTKFCVRERARAFTLPQSKSNYQYSYNIAGFFRRAKLTTGKC